MSRIVAKPSRNRPPQEDKPFYGWRFVRRAGPNGKSTVERQLLTLEDVLHPQEGDDIAQNSLHMADEVYLYNVCHAREAHLHNGLVLGDCLIDWGIPGLGNHAADISVFDHLKAQLPEDIGTFRLGPSGGRCLLVMEIVSPADPDTRKNDVDHKLSEYHLARVPLYVIVDQKKKGGQRELLAYRNTAGGYVKKPLDSRGRILIRPLGIRIGLKDNRVICYDADTDEELGNYAQVERDLLAAKQRAQEETQARQAAEQEAREQALARQAAEQARQAAELARQAAEQDASEQALARQAAEARLRELEAQLRSR